MYRKTKKPLTLTLTLTFFPKGTTEEYISVEKRRDLSDWQKVLSIASVQKNYCKGISTDEHGSTRNNRI